MRRRMVIDLLCCYFLHIRAGELTPDEIEKLVAIIQNPRQFKVPDWFLNKQRDWKTGKSSQVGGMMNALSKYLKIIFDR